MYALSTCTHISGMACLLGLLAFGTLGCEGLSDSFPSISVAESRPDPVALYEVKHRIYEDLRGRSDGSIQDCPVIFKAPERRTRSTTVALSNQSSSPIQDDRAAWQTSLAQAQNAPSPPASPQPRATAAQAEEKSIYDIEDDYVSIHITQLTEPDFYRIDLASTSAKTASLRTNGEARVELKDGRTFERHPIEVTYYLAEDQDGWRCVHAHAIFDPEARNRDGQQEKRPPRIGW